MSQRSSALTNIISVLLLISFIYVIGDEIKERIIVPLTICHADHCSKHQIKGSDYCEIHTCKEASCNKYVKAYVQEYCSRHSRRKNSEERREYETFAESKEVKTNSSGYISETYTDTDAKNSNTGNTSANNTKKYKYDSTKYKTEWPDPDDYGGYEDDEYDEYEDGYGDFMDDWDGRMPDGSDAEDYWNDW